MFDPFLATDPPVLVHEVGAHEFEEAWADSGAGNDQVPCPQCGQGHAQDRGVGKNKQEWIQYSCGDFVTQEITAG